MTYDLVVVGGGPAGVAAGVYASRKQLKTAVITKEWGGQSTVSAEIQNWIGTISISGADLAKSLKEHLEAYAGEYVTLVEGKKVTAVRKEGEPFILTTDDGETYTTKTLLITSGADRRKLDVPGAKEFDQKGLTYCASCDGPLFEGQDVVVIGGGNAGFETAAQLLAYTKSVTLLHRNPEFKADPVTVKKVLANPKMKAITNAETLEVKGEKFVTSLTYKDNETDEKHDLAVTGVFVEIGLIPATSYVENLLELDSVKRIVVNPKNQQAKLLSHATPGVSDARRGEGGEEDVVKATAPETRRLRNDAGDIPGGVWAAGDCTDELYHQNNIAAGDAVKALEDIYTYLHAR